MNAIRSTRNTLAASACALALAAPSLVFAGQSQPAATAAVSAVTANSDAASPDYRLGSGDKLRVEVYREPQLSQSLQIRPDGKITLPLVGDMTAAGLTAIQLRDRIGASLKDYVNNPVVTVMVVEAIASTVYVMGEVNKPGTVALTGPTTVLQVLAMAGGFKDFAKTTKIQILRHGPQGVETIKFSYKDALKSAGQPMYVQRGDTIIVP